MLIEEARWISEQVKQMEDDCFPMVNIGSSTAKFRNEIQPFIDELIFAPLREQNKQVLHADIKVDEGVDLAGDLNDSAFVEVVRSYGVQSLLCSNLLEHVTNPRTICASLEAMLDEGGILIVTVPNIYPLHNDPIDTKFRPTPVELCALFPHCRLVDSAIVKASGSQIRTLMGHVARGRIISLYNTIKMWLLPLKGVGEWKKALADIPHLFTHYRSTCVVLRKTGEV